MNPSLLRALTWGTVAAAVLSALLLAAGEFDFGRDADSDDRPALTLPSDSGANGAQRNDNTPR
jgi:hypothetical protein